MHDDPHMKLVHSKDDPFTSHIAVSGKIRVSRVGGLVQYRDSQRLEGYQITIVNGRCFKQTDDPNSEDPNSDDMNSDDLNHGDPNASTKIWLDIRAVECKEDSQTWLGPEKTKRPYHTELEPSNHWKSLIYSRNGKTFLRAGGGFVGLTEIKAQKEFAAPPLPHYAWSGWLHSSPSVMTVQLPSKRWVKVTAHMEPIDLAMRPPYPTAKPGLRLNITAKIVEI